MPTRIELIYPVANDETRSQKGRSELIEIAPITYPLDTKCAILIESATRDDIKTGSDYLLILSIERFTPTHNVSKSSLRTQVPAVQSASKEASRDGDSTVPDSLGVDSAPSTIPAKIDNEDSRSSLSAVQEEIANLRKDVAHLIRLLESRK